MAYSARKSHLCGLSRLLLFFVFFHLIPIFCFDHFQVFSSTLVLLLVNIFPLDLPLFVAGQHFTSLHLHNQAWRTYSDSLSLLLVNHTPVLIPRSIALFAYRPFRIRLHPRELNMPCSNPEHNHSWPAEGTLVIEKCERFCAYCTEPRHQNHQWKFAWFLRRHVRTVHCKPNCDYEDVTVSNAW